MLKIETITISNIDQVKEIYEDFVSKAESAYKYENPPVPFDDLKLFCKEGYVKGYFAKLDDSVISILLYAITEYRSYEISIIHTVPEYKGEDVELDLLEKMIEDTKEKEDWDVISYAMLGEQSRTVSKITFLGFSLVGQAMVEFDFKFPDIALKLNLPPLPKGYSLDCWKPEYSEDISNIIYESFSKAPDAKFDPRFRSLEGCKSVIKSIETNVNGDFLPESTTVLLKDKKPVGVCLANLTNIVQANIPLVGLYDAERDKHLSSYMLQNTVMKSIDGFVKGKLNCMNINATVETDNFAAINMYRKVGFKETYNYPQAYLNKSTEG